MKKIYISLILIIISLIVLIGISSYYAIADFYSNSDYYNGITFYEIIVEQINDEQFLLFNLSYIILFFLLDVNNLLESKNILISIIFNTIMFIFIFLAANLILLVWRLDISKIFSNTWSENSEFAFTGLTPFLSFLISILLFSLRLIFVMYFVYIINYLTKKEYWGFWIILLISHIDFKFYDITSIEFPIYILPIEHTRIVYTIARAVPAYYIERFSYLISIAYWGILILIIDIILSLIVERERRHNEKVSFI